jgi:hypothetical protein
MYSWGEGQGEGPFPTLFFALFAIFAVNRISNQKNMNRQDAKTAKKTESSKQEFLIPWRSWRLGGSIVFLLRFCLRALRVSAVQLN